jgi:predicted MFS family arabinose efflux permease
MWLAYLVNMTAFPITSPGLLPYVARDIYHMDQTGLGTLVASFATGALLGSLCVSYFGKRIPPGRVMLMASAIWHALLLVFIFMPTPTMGRLVLVIAGFTQSLSMVPLAVMLLNVAGERYRGRVMGVRMLAIYGMPVGLVAAGPLVERIGYVPTASGYCVLGILLTIAIAVYWRADIWAPDAAGNRH